jgi:hypothetical protein
VGAVGRQRTHAGPGDDAADAGHGDTGRLAGLADRRGRRRCGGEAQLVVVAAGRLQHAPRFRGEQCEQNVRSRQPVELERIPISSFAAKHVETAEGLTAIVSGGDDYELCFTANPNSRESIDDLQNMLGVHLTRIGQIRRGKGVSLLGPDGKAVKVDGRGYDHFSGA